MIPFRFTHLSLQFIDQLATAVCDGESAVLLGPRFSGKRYVMDRVLDALGRIDPARVLRVCDIGLKPLVSAAELSNTLAHAARQAGHDLPSDPAEEVFAPLDRLYERTRRAVYLVVANVDGMPHRLARLFLQGVRARVADGRLIVLLSGEYDFRDLVHGPDSEFNTANQFFVQGQDEELFALAFESYAGGLSVKIDRPDAVRQRLFELTGGASFLLRLLMAAAVERRARGKDWSTSIAAEEFSCDLGWDRSPVAYWANVLRYPNRVIAGASECWHDLELLLDDQIVEVSTFQGAPGPLEFAGVAARDLTRRRLAWQSPLMRQIVKAHYTLRRLGDLYSYANQWSEAFLRYSRIEGRERIRPFDFDDRFESEHAISSLCSAMHAEVEKGVEHLRDRLADGVRLLLGFPHVSFWRLERMWAPVGPSYVPDSMKDEVPKMLPVGEQLPVGWLPVPGDYQSYSAAALFPSFRPGRYMAVVIGDFESQTAISRERERLLRKLVSHFITAHRRALDIELTRQRLARRDQQREILTSVAAALAKDVLDVQQVLRMAAEGLTKFDYYRVEFCFVDARRERIQGVVDLNADPNRVNVAEMTDWPLDPPTADIQPYVVHTRQIKIVPDPYSEPLINPKVLAVTKLRPLAIIPILNQNQVVIGTIHVERNDSLVPNHEEVHELLFFGRHLAAVIEQSERVRLLHHALDKISSPVALVHVDGQPLYSNRPAAELFLTSPSWRDPYSDPASPANWGEYVGRDLKECLEKGQRMVHHYSGIGVKKDYRGTVLCDKIDNWLGKTAAAVVHVQDLNYLETVFDVFGKVAGSRDTESACENLLKACLQLGAKCARLYFIDDFDASQLVGKLWEGEGDERLRADFPDRLRFKRGVRPEFGWLAIDERAPQVFCYQPDGFEGQRLKTRQGLEFVVVTNPPPTPYALKSPGDFWIDLPLLTPVTVIGKVTLHYSPEPLPDQFEMLKVLSDSTAALLGVFADKEFIQRAAAERAMAAIAHNLNTRLAALPGILTLYKDAERTPTDLPDLNRAFEHVLQNALGTVRRTNELLAAIRIRPEMFDLADHLQEALRSAMAKGPTKVLSVERPLTVSWDSHKFESAILEMIRNSLQAKDEVAITIEIGSLVKEEAEWVRILYHDDGPGIPLNRKKMIFEHFFSSKSEPSNTGLGLWFVRRVIRAHGGTIREEGVPGKGVLFLIEMPRWAQELEVR